MLILITGGSGSGKSAYAESRVTELGEHRRIYVATMYPFDEESRRRIARHRKMRAEKNFQTVECYTGLENLSLEGRPVVLLECMSNLAANEMFRKEGAGENTVEAVIRGVKHLEEQSRALIIVTNEIFSETASYEGDTEKYREYLGRINQELGKKACEVIEVVYGIPIFHKKGREIDEKAVEQF